MRSSERQGVRRELGKADVVRQLRDLGVASGGVLLVHTSFRAVRPIEGGPRGLIEALREAIGPDGTLVMPAWTEDDQTPLDPWETPAARDLGVVADTFWRLPGVLRSEHAFAFAAAGPAADQITSDPLPLPSGTWRRTPSSFCTRPAPTAQNATRRGRAEPQASPSRSGLRRTLPGETPRTRLNARLNAASES